MTARDGAGPGWRARWVERENERRRTAYDAALREWRRRDEELRRLYAAAEEPAPPAGTPPDLPLDDDEIVLAVQPAAELVEVTARHASGLPAAELTVVPVDGTPARRPPTGVRVVDAGTAVVTDRRLILLGRDEHQDWRYERLAGVAHHPAEPVTLLHPQGPGRIRGVRVPPAAASDFRLRLTVAYAESAGARAALLERLDDAIVAHWHDRPPVPAPATPADAPVTARLVRPALIAAVAVAGAVAAVVGVVHGSVPNRPVVGMEVDGGAGVVDPTGPVPPSTSLGAPVSATAPYTGPRTSGGTTGPGPGPAPTTAAAAAATPAPTGARPVQPSPPPGPTSPTPSPPASPSPTPPDRCGAPENPYGYTYCPGGALIYQPEPGVCDYFSCVDNFWDGRGYLVLCNDGLVSRTGMGTQPCSGNGGPRQDVYDAG